MKSLNKYIYRISFAFFIIFLLFRLGYDISKIEMFLYIGIFSLFISKGMRLYLSKLENEKKALNK